MSEDEGEREKTEQESDLRKTITAVGVAIGLAVAGIVLFVMALETLTPLERASKVGVTLLIGGASFLLGAFLGFLFGIPRTLQQGSTGSDAGTESAERRNAQRRLDYQVNTNFEQISDWLTKILVGVALTQLGTVPERFWAASGRLAAGLGDTPAAHAVTAAVILHFLLTGFFFGYLLTRLFLTRAFRRAEMETVGAVAAVKAAAQEALGRVDTRLIEGELFKALYAPAPAGFRRAIELGERYVRENPDASAEPWIYIAAAYGQAYRWERDQGQNRADVLAELRDKAIAAVKKVLELDPGERARLSLLWNPTSGSEDNDLEVFKDDPEFANLLR